MSVLNTDLIYFYYNIRAIVRAINVAQNRKRKTILS